MREDTRQQDSAECKENLLLGASQSEMFEFEETSAKSSNPNKADDQNPDEFNYDVDPTLHEEIHHEDTEISEAIANGSNNINSDFPTTASSDVNQEKNGDPEDSDEDEDEDDEDNMVISSLLNLCDFIFLNFVNCFPG